MPFFIAAITLGFLGSFHCIGMCGPIALALPVKDAAALKKTLLIFSYNFGRVLTYSAFGALAGLLGSGFAIAGYQQALSVVIGVLMLALFFIPAKYTGNNHLNSFLISFFADLKNEFAKLFLKNGHGSLFTIGLLNGLLPCGLVYLGVAGSIATGEPLKGALFMAFFGLGTLPMMLVLPYAGSVISMKARNRMRKIVPVFVTLTALLLILRGLNLGIPYVSPSVEKNAMEANCHPTEEMGKPSKLIKCVAPADAHKK